MIGCGLLPSNDKRELVELSGNTLTVYFYLLRNRQNCGVREIQRALGFSSSSSAYYHLEKLAHRGILTKDSYGNYRINEGTKVRLIDRFFVIRGLVFPKQLVYASATSIMCLLFTLLFWDSLYAGILVECIRSKSPRKGDGHVQRWIYRKVPSDRSHEAECNHRRAAASDGKGFHRGRRVRNQSPLR